MAAGTLVVVCDWRDRAPPPALLTAAERAHAAALPPARAREWALGRLTAAAALRWSGVAGRPGILSGPSGAPRVVLPRAAAPVTLSVAHTGTVVACAVLRAHRAGPCGVDVERVHPDNDLLLRRIAAPGDLDALDGLPPPAAPHPTGAPGAPTGGWRGTLLVSAKEAALKAYRGRCPRLRDYRLARGGPGELWVYLAGSGLPRLRLEFMVSEDLVVSCCVPPRLPLRWRHPAAAALLAAGRPAPSRPDRRQAVPAPPPPPGQSTVDHRAAPRRSDRWHGGPRPPGGAGVTAPGR